MIQFGRFMGAKAVDHVFGPYGLMFDTVPPNTIEEMVINKTHTITP